MRILVGIFCLWVMCNSAEGSSRRSSLDLGSPRDETAGSPYYPREGVFITPDPDEDSQAYERKMLKLSRQFRGTGPDLTDSEVGQAVKLKEEELSDYDPTIPITSEDPIIATGGGPVLLTVKTDLDSSQ